MEKLYIFGILHHSINVACDHPVLLDTLFPDFGTAIPTCTSFIILMKVLYSCFSLHAVSSMCNLSSL